MTKKTQAESWVKNLENNFRYGNHHDGDLIRYSCTGKQDLEYRSGSNYITLDSVFTIEQLEALLSHMKQYSKVKE